MNSKKTNRLLRLLAWLVLLCIAVTYTIIWFKSLPAPSVRAGVLWSAVAIGLMVSFKARVLRLCLANVLAVLLAITAFEAYSEARTSVPNESPPTYSVGYFSSERAAILGYGPPRGRVGHGRLERGGKLLYDVDYGIDPDGLRVAPPAANDPEGTLLFFGDSFCFGEGVSDTQTLPYDVGQLSRGRYRVYNFAFHGYGPHQMLSALEHSLVEQIVKPRGPVIAFYEGIPDHVRRVSGLAFFDTHGPRYTLDSAGVPRFAGHFDDDGGEVFLRKFYLYRRFKDVRTEIDARDIALYAAVVERSSELVAALYPGAAFHVLYWDMPQDPHTPEIASQLVRRGLRIHPMSMILPNYPAPASVAAFTIPLDGHPNAEANRVIAQYVVTHILAHSAE